MPLRSAPFLMKIFRADQQTPFWLWLGLATVAVFAGTTMGNGQANYRRIEIGVIPGGLKYNITQFDVAVGESIELTLTNNGLIPHNWLLVKSGKLNDVIGSAAALGVSGLSKDFVPESAEILHNIPLVQPGESMSITFKAPDVIGDYPYVCTFPGHANLMRGVMTVVGQSENVEPPFVDISSKRRVMDALRRSEVQPYPEGTLEKPYVIRTCMPEPNLDPAIFINHQRGYAAANYDPERGRDVPGVAHTDQGLPAAIGVNFGEQFSYCWDTVECLLMYAWTGGFLDMSVYWGGGAGGGRKRFDYVPRLLGEIIFKTQGAHPMNAHFIQPKESPSPQYRGYQMSDGKPEFIYSMSAYTVKELIEHLEKGAILIRYSITSSSKPVDIRLVFDAAIRPSLETSHGRWDGTELILTPKDAERFQLTLRY